MITSFGLSPVDFRWAVGIEDSFIPQSRPGFRSLDEYELMRHYQNWRSDLDLAAESGAQMIRWGVPWYKVEPKPGQWDWRWVDDVLDYMINVRGITPILDLMHYGTPLWLENSFINYRYPALVAQYAAEFARRYGSMVKFYTPLNEPTVNASQCGWCGEWPPYLHGLDGLTQMTMALAKGISMTVQALKTVQSDAVIVAVEALGLARTLDPNLAAEVEHRNRTQYLPHDLVTGRVDESHPLYPVLIERGARPEDLRWLQANAVSLDFLGVNYYPWSAGELAVRRDGRIRRVVPPADGRLLAIVLKAAYDHYKLPLLVTETSALGKVEHRATWMSETLDAVKQVRGQGVPVVGYTWFPLFSMVDWKYRKGSRPLSKYLIHLGMYEVSAEADGSLPRRVTDLVAQYRGYTQNPTEAVGEVRPVGFEFRILKTNLQMERMAQ